MISAKDQLVEELEGDGDVDVSDPIRREILLQAFADAEARGITLEPTFVRLREYLLTCSEVVITTPREES